MPRLGGWGKVNKYEKKKGVNRRSLESKVAGGLIRKFFGLEKKHGED